MGKVGLAALTVRLQVSNYSQLSDYKSTEKIVKYKAPSASITFNETVIVMINLVNVSRNTQLIESFIAIISLEEINLFYSIAPRKSINLDAFQLV